MPAGPRKLALLARREVVAIDVTAPAGRVGRHRRGVQPAHEVGQLGLLVTARVGGHHISVLVGPQINVEGHAARSDPQALDRAPTVGHQEVPTVLAHAPHARSPEAIDRRVSALGPLGLGLLRLGPAGAALARGLLGLACARQEDVQAALVLGAAHVDKRRAAEEVRLAVAVEVAGRRAGPPQTGAAVPLYRGLGVRGGQVELLEHGAVTPVEDARAAILVGDGDVMGCIADVLIRHPVLVVVGLRHREAELAPGRGVRVRELADEGARAPVEQPCGSLPRTRGPSCRKPWAYRSARPSPLTSPGERGATSWNPMKPPSGKLPDWGLGLSIRRRTSPLSPSKRYIRPELLAKPGALTSWSVTPSPSVSPGPWTAMPNEPQNEAHLSPPGRSSSGISSLRTSAPVEDVGLPHVLEATLRDGRLTWPTPALTAGGRNVALRSPDDDLGSPVAGDVPCPTDP